VNEHQAMFIRILLAIAALLSTTDVGVAGAETWSLVFDAGSSGTRLNLFKIKREAGKPDEFTQFIPKGDDEDKLKLTPGLSGRFQSAKGNAAEAEKLIREDLKKLLAEGAKHVPKDMQASTPVRLGATAGLRLLTIKEQDGIMGFATKALSDKTINTFKSYGAIVLSGEEEAIYGWLAVNYFSGKFNTYVEKSTVGSMDLGGASTQIAYYTPSQILEGQQTSIVNGNSYRIFATSFLKYGNEQFSVQVFEHIKKKSKTASTKDKRHENPCQCKGFNERYILPNDPGYFVGTGKWDDCSTLVGEVLNLDNQQCVFTNGNGRCTLLNKYLAPMGTKFYAYNAYFFAANGIGLLGWNDAKKLSADDFKTKGKEWCAKEITTFPSPNALFKQDYCRQSAYIYNLLTKAYGFKADDKTSITFARKVNGFGASWAMGLAMSYSPSSNIASIKGEANKALEDEKKKADKALEDEKKKTQQAIKDKEAALKNTISGGIGIGAGHELAICVAIATAFSFHW